MRDPQLARFFFIVSKRLILPIHEREGEGETADQGELNGGGGGKRIWLKLSII